MPPRRSAARTARRCARIARCAKVRQHQAKSKLRATSLRHRRRGTGSMKRAAMRDRPSTRVVRSARPRARLHARARSRRRMRLGEKGRRPPIHGAASQLRAANRTEARATRTTSANRVRRTGVKRPRTRATSTDRPTRAASTDRRTHADLIRHTRADRILRTRADRTARLHPIRADHTVRLLRTRVGTLLLRGRRAALAAAHPAEAEAARIRSSF
jgi:hypothetical protein